MNWLTTAGDWCMGRAATWIVTTLNISDIGIGICYVLIAALLVRYAVKLPHEIRRRRFFDVYGAFIFLCGLTHLTQYIVFSVYPAFEVQAILKATTCVVSLVALIMTPSALRRFTGQIRDAQAESTRVLQRVLELQTELDARAHDERKRILAHQHEIIKRIDAQCDTTDAVLAKVSQAAESLSDSLRGKAPATAGSKRTARKAK